MNRSRPAANKVCTVKPSGHKGYRQQQPFLEVRLQGFDTQVPNTGVDTIHSCWVKHMLKILTTSMLPLFLLAGCERYAALPQCSSFLDTGHPLAMQLDANGSALDKAEGLRWYRCSAGQRFSNNQCVGDAIELPRQEALAYACLLYTSDAADE